VSERPPQPIRGGASVIAFYISGHGFGHASRVIEVVNAVAALAPSTTIIIRTAAARWLFEVTLRTAAEYHHVVCDVGVLQTDSLHLDIPGTFREASRFYAGLDSRAEDEARFLRQRRVDLVVADMPPLAFVAADKAGIPSVAMGNFTWDWIYSGYPEAMADAPELVSTIRRSHSLASLVVRLPMWGGFEGFGCPVVDVPFVARRSSRDPSDVRIRIGVPDGDRMVLASFGGLGIAGLNLEPVAHADGYTVVTTGHALGLAGTLPSRVVLLDDADVYAAGLRYEDLVRAADLVVTKPGYGILAECLANDTAVLYTSRGHFVEYDVMVAAMPGFLRCRFIDHDDLYSGRWQPHLDRLLAQPAPPTRPATNGADEAARHIFRVLSANGPNTPAF
jgi:L-arabinokinase